MSDADDRFLAALAPELSVLLGPRLDLLGLDLERPGDDRVRITALIGTSAGIERIVEDGDSLTSVTAALIERAPIHRLADGFREIVEPSTMNGMKATPR
jgi:hypothetical protein